MFQGLRTVVYPVDNLGEVAAWHRTVPEQSPYFKAAFYAGFNAVGGCVWPGRRPLTQRGARPFW